MTPEETMEYLDNLNSSFIYDVNRIIEGDFRYLIQREISIRKYDSWILYDCYLDYVWVFRRFGLSGQNGP